ncbi:BolA/IbaG family iron-sulfur metabolism protein [Candidatus Berkiella aquae]|uniref:BolA family transcriptional regulator n=1 Tax=Candidatus Berkiella aquae TaxID=295108 RepID=A0A0Q9YJC6_9GAMM|nr:BolA family protein [Candidatus Berkiella aquae]MCS5710739.1 BolA family transcriptional regulator [Candidatus Berkiella aquae]
MHPEDIQKMIQSKLPNSTVEVTGDGRHFEAIVVCAQFEGMGLLARQRAVYGTLDDHIHNGNIHALSIKAKTPAEWESEKK